MAYQNITCKSDSDLVVMIDWDDPTARVWFDYSDCGEQGTPYQTADMPADAQEAAEIINAYAESMQP